MWHVSVGNCTNMAKAKKIAFKFLSGVGDVAAGQWIEKSPRTYQVKRRLTAKEQRIAGAPVDIRGTTEEVERVANMSPIARHVCMANEMAGI